MAIYAQLENKSLDDLQRLFDCEIPSELADDEDQTWYEELAISIAKAGGDGDAFLLDRIPKVDSNRLRAILVGLCFGDEKTIQSRRGALKHLLLELLNHQEPLIAAEAIDSLNHFGIPIDKDRIDSLLDSRSPYIVGAALRFLSRHHPELAKPILIRSLKSPDPIIRQNAVDELDELECYESLPHLQPLLSDEDENVRLAARTAVNNLHGQAG